MISSAREILADMEIYQMADLTLYHASPSRSSIVLWMLEEIGEPYDIKLIKLSEAIT